MLLLCLPLFLKTGLIWPVVYLLSEMFFNPSAVYVYYLIFEDEKIYFNVTFKMFRSPIYPSTLITHCNLLSLNNMVWNFGQTLPFSFLISTLYDIVYSILLHIISYYIIHVHSKFWFFRYSGFLSNSVSFFWHWSPFISSQKPFSKSCQSKIFRYIEL